MKKWQGESIRETERFCMDGLPTQQQFYDLIIYFIFSHQQLIQIFTWTFLRSSTILMKPVLTTTTKILFVSFISFPEVIFSCYQAS